MVSKGGLAKGRGCCEPRGPTGQVLTSSVTQSCGGRRKEKAWGDLSGSTLPLRRTGMHGPAFLGKSPPPATSRVCDCWSCPDTHFGCLGEWCFFFACWCKRKCPQRPEGHRKQQTVCGVRKTTLEMQRMGKRKSMACEDYAGQLGLGAWLLPVAGWLLWVVAGFVLFYGSWKVCFWTPSHFKPGGKYGGS